MSTSPSAAAATPSTSFFSRMLGGLTSPFSSSISASFHSAHGPSEDQPTQLSPFTAGYMRVNGHRMDEVTMLARDENQVVIIIKREWGGGG